MARRIPSMRDGSFVHTLRSNAVRDGFSQSGVWSVGEAHGGRDDASLSGIPSGGKVLLAGLPTPGIQTAFCTNTCTVVASVLQHSQRRHTHVGHRQAFANLHILRSQRVPNGCKAHSICFNQGLAEARSSPSVSRVSFTMCSGLSGFIT
jgi:hypothetical protein